MTPDRATTPAAHAPPKHPARFSKAVLDAMTDQLTTWLPAPAWIVDPQAGTGLVHLFQFHGYKTTAIELEPEWAGEASIHGSTICGDALKALAEAFADPAMAGLVDGIVTSPCYGNRMADHHDAKDPCRTCGGSGCRVPGCLAAHPDDGQDHGPCEACDGTGLTRRHTYRAALGRRPSAGSAATMQWGPAYRDFHRKLWAACDLVLRPGGVVVLNVKNHVRARERRLVVEFHVNTWLVLGYELLAVKHVGGRGLAHGQNHGARAEGEKVAVLRKP